MSSKILKEMKDWGANEVNTSLDILNPACNKYKYDPPILSTDEYADLEQSYTVALLAYRTLCNKVSSFDIYETATNVLRRLINGQPLMPIDDVLEEWKVVEPGIWQSKRYSPMFKIDMDRENKKLKKSEHTYKYVDYGRFYCVDTLSESPLYFVSDLVRTRVIDKYFPISMPYTPSTTGKLIVICKCFLYKDAKKNTGDYGESYNYIGIERVIDTSTGYVKDVNLYLREVAKESSEEGKVDLEWVEIGLPVFTRYKNLYFKQLAKERAASDKTTNGEDEPVKLVGVGKYIEDATTNI